jgi:hypothetical protein
MSIHVQDSAAMKLLRDAVSKGYKDVMHMKKDTDLDPCASGKTFRRSSRNWKGRQCARFDSEDSRTALTNGAFFLIPLGDPRVRSETRYPGVSTVSRDLRRRD